MIKSPVNFEYGYFFILGALASENHDCINSKILIVKNQEALDFVKKQCVEKIVVLNFNCMDDSLGQANKYILRNVYHKYTEILVDGILDSFAIFSNDASSESNYYVFINSILSSVKDKRELLFTIFKKLSVLSEISASTVLDYIEQAIDSNDALFRTVIEQPYGAGIMMMDSSHASYLIWALQTCVRREECCAQALRAYLKLYYADYKLTKEILRLSLRRFRPASLR